LVKGYTRFVEKYGIGRRWRFRTHKVYMFLIRTTSRVDIAMPVCTYERKVYELVYWDLECRFLGFLPSAHNFHARNKF